MEIGGDILKYINPGVLCAFDFYDKASQKNNADASSQIMQTDYCVGLSSVSGSYIKITKLPENCTELWFSFDMTQTGRNDTGEEFTVKFSDNTLPYIWIDSSGAVQIRSSNGEVLYNKTSVQPWYGINKNIEIHIKTGENGRIDIWKDTKLNTSYRSPSAFNGTISMVEIRGGVFYGVSELCFAHFILQDTRRIGLEKFKKLTIDPNTEQNMPQGSTTTYKLSGLSDATEFSDITSVCAVLQATSRDANISTGTFSLEGADVGTIDVSDSSGKAYEIAHAEVNSLTGKPWTRDDIEGKTLSFKVNGAS